MTTTTFTATVNNTKIDGHLEQEDDSTLFWYDVNEMHPSFPEYATLEDFISEYISSSRIGDIVFKAFVEAGAPEWILDNSCWECTPDGSIEALKYLGE